MLAALRHNFGYKLLALFFAVVLHFYVAGLINARPPHMLVLPLTVRNLPPSLILDDTNLPSVTLTLDGSPEEINRLSDSAVTAWVDLSHARAGQTPPLTVHLSGLPTDITAESDPHPISLLLEPRRRRQLAVSAEDIGVAPTGYSFAVPTIAPREAIITGTHEAVTSVVRLTAQADPDQAAGAVDDDFTIVALDAAGSPVSDVTVTPPTAHVHMDLIHTVSKKTLLISADIVGLPAPPYRFGGIEIQPATLSAEGRPEQLAPIGTLTTPPIDVSGASADVVRRVTLLTPAGLLLTPRGPVTVTVHILGPPAPSGTPPAAPLSGPTTDRPHIPQ